MNKDLELRIQQYVLDRHEGVPMCANCQHFHMHYVRSGKGYAKIEVGHCATPRLKDREPWDLCDYFTRREASAPKR